ncbi:MAG TPA: FAD-dependent oxidoreductase [Rhizomicrobium sp.]|jgi:2-polyprenyl-6-methoxyphenol hydroxylase-like FAD-dependent oxidoreductase
MENLSATCVIAGGGPAGMMCGFLLARAGVDVIVLEKHKDFLRDFRGDTVHPSTLQVMKELGLLEEFLKLPHEQYDQLFIELGDESYKAADFRRLPAACKFIAFIPQWDFLDFIAARAKALPNFRLLMETEATGLLTEGRQVTGVKTNAGDAIAAKLVIAADGRASVLRDAAEFRVENLGSPMDVLWLRLDPEEGEPPAAFGRITADGMMVRFFRGTYWQCALIIRKGSLGAIKEKGLDEFRARVARLAKRKRADEIESWDDVKLLTVAVDRLPRWHRPGLLFIGDAAHAMSPIGGVGVNLAVQDAVAAANLLYRPLRDGRTPDLAAVQARRRFPTWATQKLQTAIQNGVIDPVLDSRGTPQAPFLLRLAQRWDWMRRIPARVVGMGFRPEHVKTPRAGDKR